MSRLVVNGREIPLKPGTSLNFDLNNLLFDIFSTSEPAGMFTYGFNIPATPEAQLEFGFPELMENAAPVTRTFTDVEYFDDALHVVGTLKYLGMAGTEYRFNLETGLSRVLKLLKESKLSGFSFGGKRVMGLDTDAVLAHMKSTIDTPDSFDYVFAPVYNPALYADDNDDYQEVSGRYLNYFDNNFDADGNHTEGFFLKNAKFHEYGPEGSTRHSICPFPYLKYVLLQALRELRIVVEDNFFDQELSTLVLPVAAPLDSIKPVLLGADEVVFEHNIYKTSFFIADLLPDISVWDLLMANMKTWGMFPDLTLDGKLILRKVKDIVESNAFDEMSLADTGFESENDSAQGVSLTYNLDSEDSIAAESIKDFGEVILKDPVADLATLNSEEIKAQSQVKHVRYVQGLDQFFIYNRFRKSRYLDAEYFWEFYSENFAQQKLGEGGAELQQGVFTSLEQNHYRFSIKIKDAVTHLDALYILKDVAEQDKIEDLVVENDVRLVQDLDKYYIYSKGFTSSDYEKSVEWRFFCDNTPHATAQAFRKWLVPAIGVRGYSQEYDQDTKAQGVRLLFYRGLQPYSDTNAMYPHLSSEAYNARGNRTGNYTMRWHGPDGLLERFWKKYFDIKLQGKPARRKIYLEGPEMQNINLLRKKKIDGVLYFIVRIRFSSPLRKAATLDLISCD